MTNTEGFIYLVFIAAVLLAIFGLPVLLVLNEIMRRLPHRILRLVIPCLVLLLGYYLLMPANPSFVIMAALLFVGPVATLIPPFAIPDLLDPKLDQWSRLLRIVICYFPVSVCGVLLLIVFTTSALPTNPDFYFPTPVSNGEIYAGEIITDILVAFLIYWIMRAVHPLAQRKDEKPEK
jgi:hypothetical protein